MGNIDEPDSQGQIKKSLYALTEPHLDRLRRSTIPREIANQPFVDLYSVDDHEGARLMGQERELKFGRSFSGIAITYHTADGRVREYRLRRDHPDIVIKDGREKEEAKYLTPGGRGNMAYFPLLEHPDTFCKWLNDTTIPIVFCEGEFKALCLMRIALSVMTGDKPPFIVIGLAGVWNFRGRIGKTADGREEKDIIHDIYSIPMKGRKVTIFYDANIRWNQNVRAGRRNFAYALRDTFEAQVFFTEMPEDAEADGLNGPDDLAFARGDQAVIDCLNSARPAFKPPQPKRESYEEKVERGRHRRKVLTEGVAKAEALEADQYAKQALGVSVYKRLSSLWAQAGGLSPANRDLLFTLHAMGEGKDEFSFYYRDLYRLLFRADGSELENGKLTSTARQKIRRRFNELEKAEKACGIEFVQLQPGGQNKDGKRPSKIRLLSYDYVEEIESLAATDPQPGHAAFERAIKEFIKRKTGKAPQLKTQPPRSPFIEIKDGWRRVKGNLRANVERMRGENYYDEAICDQLIEVIPPDLLTVLQARLAAKLPAQEVEISAQKEAETGTENEDFSGNFGGTKLIPLRSLESAGYRPFFDKNANFDGGLSPAQNSPPDDLVAALLEDDLEQLSSVQANGNSPP